MISPKILASAVETYWRADDLFLLQMRNNPQNIKAYHNAFPVYSSVDKMLRNLPAPGCLIYWAGTEGARSFGDVRVWVHRMVAVIRPMPTEDPESPYAVGCEEIALLLMGTGARPRFVNTRLLLECHEPDVKSVQTRADSNAMEYLEIVFELVEIGDN